MSQWADKSGNGLHLSQTDAAKRPGWAVNSWRGRSTVQYTLGNLLRRYTASAIGGSGFTIAVAFVKTGPVAGAESLPLTLTNPYAAPMDAYNNLRWVNGLWWSGADVKNQTSWCSLITAVAPGSPPDEWLNGIPVSMTFGQSGSGTLPTGGQKIVSGSRDDEYMFFGGEVGEILLLDAVVSTPNRQALEGYLRQKWGTP